MAEYIERDKLSADFELCNKQNPRWTPQRVASLIARANAADVAPVVHGRWVYKNGRIVCDQCGTLYAVCPNRDDMEEIMKEMKGFEKFCFNCGADMRGE